MLPLLPILLQLAQDDDLRPLTLTDRFPWLPDTIITLLAVALLCVLVYLFRPASPISATGFSIIVEGDDVLFKGRFPPEMQATVEDFLLQDCRIPGSYTVLGSWNENGLAVTVRGQNAKPMEQRIRNFLKLNLKRPT